MKRRMYIPFQCIGIVLALLTVVSARGTAQVNAIPIHELTDSMRLSPKPALILLSTDWCTYCAMQKAQLKKNKHFQEISASVHFSEFDAETKVPIRFGGHTYHFEATGATTGAHELAHALGTVSNRLAYPTWVLINEKFEVLLQYPGVLGPEALEVVFNAISETTETQ